MRYSTFNHMVMVPQCLHNFQLNIIKGNYSCYTAMLYDSMSVKKAHNVLLRIYFYFSTFNYVATGGGIFLIKIQNYFSSLQKANTA